MLSQLLRLLRENRELSTFVICAAASFVFLALPPSAKEGTSAALATVFLDPFKRLTTGARDLAGVREENAELRRLAAELAAERARLVEYRHENERLRELIGFFVSFSDEERFEMLPARVVGMPGGRIIERIELDKGRDAGVRSGMPVIVPEGLIGKIVEVEARRSTVEPLASASSAVSVVIERSRVRGVLRPRYGPISDFVSWGVDYVPARSDVRLGDRIITSGLGGIYPPGISVGTVISIEEDPLTMSVGVRLAVDYATVERVFVLTGTRRGTAERDDREARLLDELIGPAPTEETE
jgi:rod shape-determining protein MreC